MKEKTLKIAQTYLGKSRDDRFQGEPTELDEGVTQGKAKFNTDKSKCASSQKNLDFFWEKRQEQNKKPSWKTQ